MGSGITAPFPHVAIIHDAVIPPVRYGGTERVVYWLCKALGEMGIPHTLIAKKGSGRGLSNTLSPTRIVEIERGHHWSNQIPREVDLLHLFGTPREKLDHPFLVTIEGNGRPGEVFGSNTVFISKRHAHNHGASVFVYNGLDPSETRFDPTTPRERRLVFLAKASWDVKNLEGAIAVARAAGWDLDVCGSRNLIWNLQKRLPRFRHVRYLGMVDDIEKRQVLKSAGGLIFPVRWDEPFGIALTEALAAGCFVLGTPYGSLPEIVSSEVGVLSSQGCDLVNALARAPEQFKPQACRDRIQAGFSHRQMAESYLVHYRSILETGRLAGIKENLTPKTREGFEANQLLPWTNP